MRPISQRVLLYIEDDNATFSSTSFSTSLTTLLPKNQGQLPFTEKPNNINSTLNPTSLDSSLSITLLVLLIALFFLAFFSIYIRRLTSDIATIPSPPLQLSNPNTYPSTACGIDGTVLATLPVYKFDNSVKNNVVVVDCAVCLSDFKEGEIVKVIPGCGHVYHPECIDSWLSSRGPCPRCRSTHIFLPPSSLEVLQRIQLQGSAAEEVGERERGRSRIGEVVEINQEK